jgi:ankyrin repeat protein
MTTGGSSAGVVSSIGNTQALAFLRAIRDGNEARVRQMLQQGMSPNVVAANGMTALMIAADSGYGRIVQALLQAQADVSAVDSQGRTALMYAARTGNIECVTALLSRGGIGVDAQDEEGMTALMHAADRGHRAAVRAILARRPNVNVRSRTGMTAYTLAVRNGDIEIVNAIRAAGGR